jgi:very-short-patch-repair endonuclease
MNEIEQMFYDAFLWETDHPEFIVSQAPVGIYIADFLIYPKHIIPSIVEIDGHDWHKTKEQRFADYQKERFYMQRGYTVIRFMGSEVFVDVIKCVREAIWLSERFEAIALIQFERGQKDGADTQKIFFRSGLWSPSDKED